MNNIVTMSTACERVFFDPATIDGSAPNSVQDPPGFLEQSLLYTPATVLKRDSDGVVQLRCADGKVRSVVGELRPVTADDVAGFPEVLSLNDFSEMSLLHTLRIRYARDEFYSLVGPILVSINPCVAVARGRTASRGSKSQQPFRALSHHAL